MSILKDQIDFSRMPEHIAIIMDGNGRWAQQRGLHRTAGHSEGVTSVNKITEECSKLGVKYLTLYTFSTENWNRPTLEVQALMQLILDRLYEEIFQKNNVRLRVIGDMQRLAPPVREHLAHICACTQKNDGMTLILAISYSSRWEIVQAAKQLAQQAKDGQFNPSDITEDTIAQSLQTSFMPDPDLLIRTGGEFRISNYLLWQCAYSEFYFTDVLFPDFREEQLHRAIIDYQHRERRFGKTGEQVRAEEK
ncbi:MAG: isoprenyl transferase [Bacteroidales bacterium]|nr:isoprenyl transferase [Candidatus Physcousia equi]